MSRLTKVSIDSVLYDIGSKGINSYETLSDMSAEPVANLDDGAICWCKEDEKYYQWLSTNEIISVYARWRELDMGGIADKVKYENADYPELTNVDLAIDKILAKIYYVDPSITSFTMTPSTTEYEIGSVVNGLTFAWTVNKDIVGQTLTDCTITVDDRTATYGSDLSATKTFTLTVSDGENNASATKKISFLNKAYWGSAAIPGEYNSAFVLGLSNSKLTSSKASTYNMTVGAGEYGYLAVPTSFGTISSCWIGGFEVTLENCGAISFTNASGHNSSYTIYKTVQAGLGSISMQIK